MNPSRIWRKIRLFRREQFWFRSHIHPNDLVLDVGSGLSPCLRADVLCEKYALDDSERAGSLLADRPLVLGDVEALPFRDRCFDFVVCSQVLEHVPRPEDALRELQRVARRGRVDTPGGYSERIGGEPFHLWYTDLEDGVLVFREKPRPIYDEQIAAVTRRLKDSGDAAFEAFVFEHYPLFVTICDWQGEIRFRVDRTEGGMASQGSNAKASTDREDLNALFERAGGKPWSARPPWRWKRARDAKDWIKEGFSRAYRRPVEIESLLACPICKGSLEKTDSRSILCRSCLLYFPLFGSVPGLLKDYSQSVTF